MLATLIWYVALPMANKGLIQNIKAADDALQTEFYKDYFMEIPDAGMKVTTPEHIIFFSLLILFLR